MPFFKFRLPVMAHRSLAQLDRPRRKPLGFEPLEERSLLSGGSPSAAAEIPPDELMLVAESVASAFPGAALVEVSLELDGGEEGYDVVARVGGRTIEIALDLDGRILDSTAAIDPRDLPDGIVDSLAAQFPGLAIRSAEAVTADGELFYDVELSGSEGAGIDVTFRGDGRIESLEQSDEVDEPAASSASFLQSDLGIATPDSTDSIDGSTADSVPRVATSGDSSESPPASEAPKPGGRASLRDPGPSPEENADSTVAPEQSAGAQTAAGKAAPRSKPAPSDIAAQNDSAAALAAAIDALLSLPPHAVAVDAAGSDFAPRVAGLIGDALPIDVAALERSVREILEEMDFLVSTLSGANVRPVAPNDAIWLALAIIGLEALRRRANKSTKQDRPQGTGRTPAEPGPTARVRTLRLEPCHES